VRLLIMKRASVLCWLLVTSVFTIVPSANATIIAPGTPTAPPDVFDLSGFTVVADTGIVSFSLVAIGGGVAATGSLLEQVGTDSNNLFCGVAGKCLDFVIGFTNDASSEDTISRLSTASFKGFLTDVGYAVSGFASCGASGAVNPTSVDRVSPSTVGFEVSVNPGSFSNCLVIMTDATLYGAGGISLIDGGTANVAGFAPVPGPVLGAGLPGLIAACLGLIGLARRRRRRQAGLA